MITGAISPMVYVILHVKIIESLMLRNNYYYYASHLLDYDVTSYIIVFDTIVGKYFKKKLNFFLIFTLN